tara:strand:- start:919 stop:1377 length:459 start_codon:yes stop_codon:yes gene_type:complete
MLSILGSLIGFAGSAIPSVTDIFKEKDQRKHELEKMKAMAALKKEGMDFDLKMFEAKANDEEHKRLMAHDIAISQGTGFMSGLQKSVRPVITYCFFGLFAAIEITLLMDAIENNVEFSSAIKLLWDEDTKAIFAAIISFWFGSRALEKSRKK